MLPELSADLSTLWDLMHPSGDDWYCTIPVLLDNSNVGERRSTKGIILRWPWELTINQSFSFKWILYFYLFEQLIYCKLCSVICMELIPDMILWYVIFFFVPLYNFYYILPGYCTILYYFLYIFFSTMQTAKLTM